MTSNCTIPSSNVPGSSHFDPECISADDYNDWLGQYVAPSPLEWVFIGILGVLFLIGLIGNIMVIYVVLRRPAMRSVTNLFLLNLAIADCLVLTLVLPFTVLWDVTETWFLGTSLCKLIPSCQTLAVTVSIFSLTSIAVDRWLAICQPLKFRASFKRTVVTIFFVWLTAFLIAFPELIMLDTRPFVGFQKANFTTIYITDCTDTLLGEYAQLAYQLYHLILLYVLPLCLMGAMYGHIAYELWLKSMQSNSESSLLRPRHPSQQFYNSSTKVSLAVGRANILKSDKRSSSSKSINNLSTNTFSPSNREVRMRQKTAKMLILVVVIFGSCFLPTHLLNLLRIMKVTSNWSDFQYMFMMLSTRVMCYFNSVVNPIIYNFMSEKFHKEFMKICCRRYAPPDIPTPSMYAANESRRISQNCHSEYVVNNTKNTRRASSCNIMQSAHCSSFAANHSAISECHAHSTVSCNGDSRPSTLANVTLDTPQSARIQVQPESCYGSLYLNTRHQKQYRSRPSDIYPNDNVLGTCTEDSAENQITTFSEGHSVDFKRKISKSLMSKL